MYLIHVLSWLFFFQCKLTTLVSLALSIAMHAIYILAFSPFPPLSLFQK